MSFAARLTRTPIAFEPERGAEALAVLPELAPELRELVAGTAGCSPYLARLIGSEAEWLAEALAGDPEPAMVALVAAALGLEGPGTGAALRGLKRRAALLVALADLGGIWGLEEVTGALTRFADVCLRAALREPLAVEIRRGKLPGQGEDDLAEGAGMVALAMGKMGAFELNYSSDIDLICLFDDNRFSAEEEMEARAGFIRATRRMAATLGENTAEGYVFRTDLRLRPDASVTPVCISMTAAERYYEAEGRTWERGAYIKARPAAGAITAGERFLEVLRPFVWRRHLDFAAIHETQDMRRRIRDHKGLYGGLHGPAALEGHNLKLGAGGIREIEFFAQTRQLIAGGRDPGLRQRGTVEALEALAGKGWIGTGVAAALAGHYRALRELEHRLQMKNDAQTHSMPQSPQGIAWLAAFCGEGDVGAFRASLSERLSAVIELTGEFFEPGPRAVAAEDEPELGRAMREIVARWPGYPALRSARAREIFARLRPELLGRLAKAAKPEEALASFDGFLRGLPAGVQIFALFEANPPLIDLINDICAISPALAQYLSRNSKVFDAVIGGDFFAPWPETEALVAGLRAAMGRGDYERALDAARVWQREWHFRIGVHLLRGLVDPAEAGAQYAALAEATVAGLWPVVLEEIGRRHGPPPGIGGAVVAMGSLGAGALNAGSDLDLIVIYDTDGVEVSDGPRPIAARAWYAKATKALVAALSAPTAEGTLYEVDMRLRPSGRQGPVATGVTSFARYQREEAWTWEHLALTRARAIAGPAPLLAEIERIRQEVVAETGGRGSVLADTAKMRARLREAGRSGGTYDVKAGPGGTQDIELLAQAGALIAGSTLRALPGQLAATARAGVVTEAAAETLRATHALFQALRQAEGLLADGGQGIGAPGAGAEEFLLRVTGASDPAALAAELDGARAAAADIIGAALPDAEDDEP